MRFFFFFCLFLFHFVEIFTAMGEESSWAEGLSGIAQACGVDEGGGEDGTQAPYIVLHRMTRAFQLVALRCVDLQIVW